MAMQLREIRKASKVKINQIKLDSRTIKKIEAGSDDVTVKSLNTYLESIGLQLTYSIR